MQRIRLRRRGEVREERVQVSGDVLPVGFDVGGYRIERLIGTGHMGAVYLAQSPELKRNEALKVLKLDLLDDAAFRDRFLREADLAAQLSHPAIVPVYRRGSTDDGLLWISMLYVDGTDADTAVRQGRVSSWRALHIGTEVGKALDYAHRCGVVHRDVKPANFLLSKQISPQIPEHVFLGDFGLAHSVGQSQLGEHGGAVLATVGYAAPEVLAGAEVDTQADLYSLGCSLFRMLTGERPFSGAIDQVIEGHLSGRVPRVSQLCAGVPRQMDSVIDKAMAKDPAHRFSSAAELMGAAVEALKAPAARRRSGPPARPVVRRSQASGVGSQQLAFSLWSGTGRHAAPPRLDDLAPPLSARRAGSARLYARAAAASVRGRGRGPALRRAGLAAAVLAMVVAIVWWLGSPWSEETTSVADTSAAVTISVAPTASSGAGGALAVGPRAAAV